VDGENRGIFFLLKTLRNTTSAKVNFECVQRTAFARVIEITIANVVRLEMCSASLRATHLICTQVSFSWNCHRRLR